MGAIMTKNQLQINKIMLYTRKKITEIQLRAYLARQDKLHKPSLKISHLSASWISETALRAINDSIHFRPASRAQKRCLWAFAASMTTIQWKTPTKARTQWCWTFSIPLSGSTAKGCRISMQKMSKFKIHSTISKMLMLKIDCYRANSKRKQPICHRKKTARCRRLLKVMLYVSP